MKAQLDPAEFVIGSRNIRHKNCKLVFILITVALIHTVETKIRIVGLVRRLSILFFTQNDGTILIYIIS